MDLPFELAWPLSWLEKSIWKARKKARFVEIESIVTFRMEGI